VSWETVIGLEVHVQLGTRTKIFCGCPVAFGAPANTNVCPVCLGLPGALPVLNDGAVDMALTTCVALECEVQETSIFARKNYFYPDLPKGYQISQYDRPLAIGGRVPIEIDGERRVVPLERIHLEEDAGKLMHDEAAGRADSRIDLNRCGTPLLEIVSGPSLRRPAEAAAVLESLRQIVQYLGVSDGDMSHGSLRCDANVSVRRLADAELGTKTEVKNLNSIKMVEKAIEVESERQIAHLESGGKIEQETLLWDDDEGAVRPLRSKEHAHDYRYFPEPDLMPLVIDGARRQRVRGEIPELPFSKRDRFVEQYDLPEYDAGVLTASRDVADWFEDLAIRTDDPKAASHWTMGEVLRVRSERGGSVAGFPVSVDRLAELLSLVRAGTISVRAAKTVFAKMLETEEEPAAIVEREGLAQISDPSTMEAIVDDVLAAHPGQVAEFRSGKEKVLGFLVGEVMKASHGKANPKMANELLRERLQSGHPA
jgi:aspartyl-tRNA(Asn)/glutamyl-tRNA(Gln) amidotransferase subunit B